MGKNILIILSLVFIVYFVKTSLLSEKEVVINSDEKMQVVNKSDTNKIEIENNINTNKKQLLNQPKELSHYSFYGKSNNCGFSQELYDKRNAEIDIKELKEEEIEKFYDSMQECNVWFARLQDVPVEKLKQLEIDVKKKRGLLTKLFIYEYSKDILSLARKEVFNDDPDINFIALEYLLKFDFDFQKQVAQEMNVSNISYLSANGSNFIFLFLCQHGYDCSAQSQIMQDTCRRDENSCDMSFPAWLRSGQISLNLYDDMMRAIIAIDIVLDSDWFLENPLDI